MQADERRAVGRLPPDHQRDVLAHVVGAAEDDDLGGLARRDRQARARGDLQPAGVAQRGDVVHGDRNRFAGGHGRHEERRQDAGDERQLHRRFGFGAPRQGLGAKRALERGDQVERGVGDRARRGKVERFGGADQHRRVRVGRLALVGELEGRGARGGNQRQVRCGFAPGRGLYRQEQGRLADRQRPAVAQRVDRLRRAPRRRGFAQSANSVISGTWSEGCSQVRVSSTKRCAVACGASCGEAHMWSSRRPWSFCRQ